MARENLDLYNIGTEPEELQAAIVTLRQDFDAHTHDGINSKSFQTLLAETIVGRTAIIGGYRLFNAIVGPDSADFKSVAAALNAGKTRIFVRNGTYTSEPMWNVTNANTIVVGESLGGVSITFAQDLVTSRSIYVNATRATFENLNLISYEAATQTLFQFGSSGSYPTVKSCILRNKRGRFLDGTSLGNLYGTFQDLYLDCTATLDATLMKGFYVISNSVIINCIVDMNFASSAFNVVDTCVNSFFFGCAFKMNTAQAAEFVIASSSTCFFTGCYFYQYQLTADANFNGCFFENNGNSPANYMIKITTASMRFNNNRVKAAAGDNMLTVIAANVQINSNWFDGGKKILIEPSIAQVLGNMFCNNEWVSSYATAAMDIQVGSVGHVSDNSNFAYNVIRNNSNSFTPTITDNSVGNNVTGNQLIKG